MRLHAITAFIAMLCFTAPSWAGALEICYQTSSNGHEADACLDRYFSAAQQQMAGTYALAAQQAEIIGGNTPQELEAVQEKWESYTLSNCRMHRIAAGAGSGSEMFEKACLVDAYGKRARELQIYFPALTRGMTP